MQAPKSIRLRLIEAAGSNDVHELQRLCKLDMATSNDYQLGIKHAVEQRAMAAAIFLWQCTMDVPDEEEQEHEHSPGSMAFYLAHRSHEKSITSYETGHCLVRLVLTSADTTGMLYIARRAPEWFLLVIENMCLDDAHENVLHLAHLNRTEHIFPDKTAHARLLGCAMLAALAMNQHPWQGMHVRLRDLCGDDMVVCTIHILYACIAIERCPDGTEERAMLYMLLDGWRVQQEKEEKKEEEKKKKKNNLQSLMLSCFYNTATGLSVRYVLDHWAIDDADNTYVSIACASGSCVSMEACFDRIPHVDAALADRLLGKMAQNPYTATGSRSLAHVLERLLRHASPLGVSRARSTIHKQVSTMHMMHLYLVEHSALCYGWSVNCVSSLDQASFLWLLQRNRSAIVALHPHVLALFSAHYVTWRTDFLAQQAPIRDRLLASSPLAADIVELTLQYA
jgi:hypothetical protein